VSQWWSDKMGSGGACFFVTDAALVCKLPEQHDHAAAALVRLSRTAKGARGLSRRKNILANHAEVVLRTTQVLRGCTHW
jgi:hypothetical protein